MNWIKANEVPNDNREVLLTILYGVDGNPNYEVIIGRYNHYSNNWENLDGEIVVAWSEKPKPYRVEF